LLSKCSSQHSYIKINIYHHQIIINKLCTKYFDFSPSHQ
jgi:hypothetical protein